ncbi:MAG: NAD-dependent epimerase/dehydratase family protein [Gemmataceae bacterium]
MAVCLVTGGAGFIGSHVVEALVARGENVRVFDNFTTGLESNLASVSKEIAIIPGDVTDLLAVRKAMEGVDLVFHLAALAPAPSQGVDPLLVHHVVATGTLHVLQAACEVQARRVIYASSATVYRSEDDAPRQESDPTGPRSLYSIAKLTAEDYCAAFHQFYGLDTVRLRYFSVFGPRQSADNLHAELVAGLLQSMSAGKRPLLPGDGRQKRDFTYVGDVAQANLLAADAPRVAGKVFNIATGQPSTLLDLIAAINEVLGANLSVVHDRGGNDGPRHLWANIVQAQTDLGYCPCTDLKRDLRSCLNMGDENLGSATIKVRWDGPAASRSQRPSGITSPLSLAKAAIAKASATESR